MFYVLKALLIIRFRDKDVTLKEGEFVIVPKGIEDMPVADDEVHVMLIEAKASVYWIYSTNNST